jgi:phosphate uptake regulator
VFTQACSCSVAIDLRFIDTVMKINNYLKRIGDLTVNMAERTKVWQRKRNAERTSIDWRFTTADARIKLRKLYPPV